ncbi:small, acid-soluble spore protein, alpha/beta type [Clostridium algoriphilum]
MLIQKYYYYISPSGSVAFSVGGQMVKKMVEQYERNL